MFSPKRHIFSPLWSLVLKQIFLVSVATILCISYILALRIKLYEIGFISYDERKDEKDKVYTWRLLKRPLLRIFRFQASFNYFELVDEKLFHLNVILKIFFDHSSI